MLNRTFVCLLMIMSLALGVPAQDWLGLPPLNGGPKLRLEASAPPLSTTFVDSGLMSVHADGVVSLVAIDEDGTLLASFAASGGVDTPQAFGDPVPTLRTTWCDKDGVTHEVVTPIVSTTDAGLQRAINLHNQLVGIMQRAHPPKPCPPPPPPPGP